MFLLIRLLAVDICQGIAVEYWLTQMGAHRSSRAPRSK